MTSHCNCCCARCELNSAARFWDRATGQIGRLALEVGRGVSLRNNTTQALTVGLRAHYALNDAGQSGTAFELLRRGEAPWDYRLAEGT